MRSLSHQDSSGMQSPQNQGVFQWYRDSMAGCDDIGIDRMPVLPTVLETNYQLLVLTGSLTLLTVRLTFVSS